MFQSSDHVGSDDAAHEDEGFMGMLPLQAHHAMERMEEFVCKVRGCKASAHHALVCFTQLLGPLASSACTSGNKEPCHSGWPSRSSVVLADAAAVRVGILRFQ